MQFRQNLSKRHFFLLFVTLMGLLTVSSCVPAEDSTSKTGALSFHVVYHDNSDGDLRSERSATAKIDCAGQGIVTIEAKVYGADIAEPTTGGPWNCDEREGTIDHVPAGSDRTVMVFGRDADGNVILSGQEPGVTVNAGSENNDVIINCEDFLSAPADAAAVKQGAVVLQWHELAGTVAYRVLVSQNSDMSDPVIEHTADTADYAPSGLIPMTTYYWQVFADDTNGNQWIASQIRSFTVAGALPDTGQTYDAPNVDGEDSAYTLNPPAYTKLDASGNALPDDAGSWDMVRDDITGLTWEVKTDYYGIHNVQDTYTWQSAQDDFIARLNNDHFGGYADWRLPTIHELFTLADKGRYHPAVNTDYFLVGYSTTPSYPAYWSSTTNARDLDYAWRLTFHNGDTNIYAKVNTAFVLAVRGEQHPSTLVDNGDGTVTDSATGLMWQQDGPNDAEGNPSTMTWEEALAYCQDLPLAGHDDWRLPNINELQSIIDFRSSNPAIDTGFFPTAVLSSYWSSTTYLLDDQWAWNVKFHAGDILYEYQEIIPDKSERHYVRAVRGGP